MTFGSLFAGVGGIDLALKRVGMTCKWQVELDDYARGILEKEDPEVPRYEDVRYFLGGKRWRQNRDAWQVDLICGGFPCQDISLAGKGAGITGSRSGLWAEYARVIRLLRPRFVLVENVPALTIRGLDRVLGDLAELGFDAEWDRIPAAAVGAPHLRWRIFILAYSNSDRIGSSDRDSLHERRATGPSRGESIPQNAIRENDFAIGDVGPASELLADASGNGRKQGRKNHRAEGTGRQESDRGVVGSNAAHAYDSRLERRDGKVVRKRTGQRAAGQGRSPLLSDAESRWSGQRWRREFAAYCEEKRNLHWPDPEPWLRRVDDGLSPTMDGVANRVDRLRCLGNAVVPQVVEWIGRRLMEHSKPS